MSFPGSRWWKCDFHTHSPGSGDFKDKNSSADEWVRAALAAGLDTVALTEHNGPGWADEIQEAAKGTNLVVFPGVEIAVNGSSHVLAILSPGTSAQAIASLLGDCQIPAERFGSCEAVSTLSFIQVAEKIEKHRGICVAAHADGPDGFLTREVAIKEDGSTSGSETLKGIVCSDQLRGVEVTGKEPRLAGYVDNSKEGYRRSDGPIALLEGSDAHRLSELGRRWTWIKMSTPDTEGLRLALMDGELSVRRGSGVASDLNACPEKFVEAIEVEQARYMGRGKPFRVDFNPWLNAVIGGHGTGKSSLIEFMRIAMRREQDIGDRGDLEKYRQTYTTRADPGLLTNNAVTRVFYRRDGGQFRIQWSPTGSVTAIEEWKSDGQWQAVPGEVRDRFPVRLFSQKQIYRLAEEPNALLAIIDETPDVDARSLRAQLDREEMEFLSLRAQTRAMEAELLEGPRLRGALDDVRRKLQVFETSIHRETLSRYQRVERQQGALNVWLGSFEETVQRAERFGNELAPEDLPPDTFPSDSDAAAEQAVIQAVTEAIGELEKVRVDAQALAQRARAALQKLESAIATGLWSEHRAGILGRYEQLKTDLAAVGAAEPSEYGRLVQEAQVLEASLRSLEARGRSAKDLGEQSSERLRRVEELRAQLTERRRQFLEKALADDEHVRVDVVPHGDHRDAERRLRECIARTDQTFQDQIWSEDDERGALRDLYKKTPPATVAGGFGAGLRALKKRLVDVARGTDDLGLHGKFIGHLRKLPPEALDRLRLILPEDGLNIAYRPRGSEDFRSIDQGSPGQKSAAILAFLLSHGSEPLILDQPEDDLDAQIISELIVAQLRRMKGRRQIVVVTHDSNVVVNGDAELIVPLVTRTGQTHVDGEGGLQEARVREAICRIMEGGRDALERRYRRIGRELGHVG